MFSSRTHDRVPQATLLLAIIAAAWLLLARIAHADPLLTVTPTGPVLGWQVWLVAILAAAGGALKILDVLIAGLRWLAPRTETTLDDITLLDAQLVHDKLDAVLRVVGGLVPAATDKPTLTIPPPPRDAQAGRARLVTITVIALIGAALAGMALIGCTSTQRADLRRDARAEVVNCTGQALGATPALSIEALVAIANVVGAERLKCTPPGGSIDWSCVESDAIREGEVIGGCSLVQLLVRSIPTSPAPATMLAAATPDPGRAALERFRARVGGATYHTATGDY